MADPVQTKNSQEITTLAKQLKTPESKVILDQMDQLSQDPQYARTAAPETKQQLQAAIAAAKEAYQNRTQVNDWAEVAQTLSNAVARFGAAQSGMKSGRDLSGVTAGPGINYEARNDRASKDYGQEIKNAGDTADRDRQNWADSEVTKKESLKQAMSPQEDRLKNAQQIELEEGREKREDSRNNRTDRKDKERIDNTNKTLEYRDLDGEERTLAKQLREQETAASTAANRIVNEDISSKDAKKNAAQYGDLLAKAGIDPDVLASIEDQSKDKGVLGTGIMRTEDKAKKAQLIQAASQKKTTEIKNALDAIRARKAALLGKGDSAGQAPASTVQSNTNPPPAGSNVQTPAQSTTVKVKGPSGTVAEMTPENAKKYLGKPGYELVK